jgi:hypothetical protein
MKNGNLGEFLGEAGVGIGVYWGENAIWILLNRRKTSKKAHKSARFDHFCTIFLQKRAAFDILLTTFLHKNCGVNNSGIVKKFNHGFHRFSRGLELPGLIDDILFIIAL